MDNIAAILNNLAELLEQILYGGHFRTILILFVIILAAVPVLVMTAVYICKWRSDRIDNDPIMGHALRLSQFYRDRPLRAEIILNHRTWRQRFQTFREKYPPCDPNGLARAIREAEFNEFVKFELDREIRELKQKNITKNRAAMNRALKMLRETRKQLPSGVFIILATKHRFRHRMNCDLSHAHAWLKHVEPRSKDPGPAETFQAIKLNHYQCAYCHRDLNDGIRLRAVVTESGRTIPVCNHCKQEKLAQKA